MAKGVSTLTNTQVDKSKPSEKQYHLADGGGLYLLIKPTGVKTWQFNYYKPITKKRTYVSLGGYPAVTLAQARGKREEYRSLLAQGIDPLIHQKQQEQSKALERLNTFSAIAENWKDKKAGEVEEKTIAKYWQQIEKHLLPVIGNYPISEITPPLITVTLKPLEKIGRTDTVHRLLIYLNDILNYAVNSGVIPFNPCLKVGSVFQKHVKKHNPFIRAEMLPQFFADIEKSNLTYQTKNVIFFKVLTLTRSIEVTMAEWSEIDFATRLWTIPAKKMKMRRDHIIPLCSQAITLLEKMRPLSGNSRYVFPNLRAFNRPMSAQTPNTAIKRNGYKDQLTAHGLRTTASTYLNEQGYDKDAISVSLSHNVDGGNVRQTYLRSNFIEQRIKILQEWGDYVEQCSRINIL